MSLYIARATVAATSSFQSSSSSISHDQNTSTSASVFTNNGENQLNYILNEINLISTGATTGSNSSVIPNYNAFSSSDQAT